MSNAILFLLFMIIIWNYSIKSTLIILVKN